MNKADFFESIRKTAETPQHYPKTELPEWSPEDIQSRQQPQSNDQTEVWQQFTKQFSAVNGEIIFGTDGVIRFLEEEKATHGYLAPELEASVGAKLKEQSLEYETEFHDTRIDDYAFGISRAAGVIAETGTVILKESSTSSRLGALAPWIHVALFDADSRIYPTLLEAIADFGDDPYIVFATGPSKTADVEGILIEGVHGPGRQICCIATSDTDSAYAYKS